MEVLFRDDSASFVDSYVNRMIGGGADKSTESWDWKTGTESGAVNVWLSSNSEEKIISYVCKCIIFSTYFVINTFHQSRQKIAVDN